MGFRDKPLHQVNAMLLKSWPTTQFFFCFFLFFLKTVGWILGQVLQREQHLLRAETGGVMEKHI